MLWLWMTLPMIFGVLPISALPRLSFVNVTVPSKSVENTDSLIRPRLGIPTRQQIDSGQRANALVSVTSISFPSFNLKWNLALTGLDHKSLSSTTR